MTSPLTLNTNAPSTAALGAAAGLRQDDPASRPFTSLLTKASTAIDSQAQEDPNAAERRGREAVEQLVASTFIQPLLTQMRNDPFKAGLFDGGAGERVWGQQLDTVMADRIVSGGRFPLVDTIYNRYFANKTQAPTVNETA